MLFEWIPKDLKPQQVNWWALEDEAEVKVHINIILYVFSCKIIILSKRKLASKIQEYCLFEKYLRAFLLFKINQSSHVTQ